MNEKKRKSHMYNRDELIRSVLLKKPVTSQCGVTKVATREEVDDATNLKPCAKCHEVAGQSLPDYTVLSPRGWLALLEREWVDAHPPRPRAFTTYTTTVKW